MENAEIERVAITIEDGFAWVYRPGGPYVAIPMTSLEAILIREINIDGRKPASYIGQAEHDGVLYNVYGWEDDAPDGESLCDSSPGDDDGEDLPLLYDAGYDTSADARKYLTPNTMEER